MNNSAISKVLVYRLGSLGDTIIALPVFHKIREVYHDAEISLLTNHPVSAKAAAIQAILGDEYFYDRIIDYPIGTRNIFVLISLLIKIRKLKINTLINITAARSRKSVIRDKIFFKIAGVKELVGFPEVDSDFEPDYDEKTGLYEWEALRLAKRIKSLGKIDFNDSYYWNLRLTKTELEAASDIVKKYTAETKIFAISFGTKLKANNWEEHNWISLLCELKSILLGWKILVIGAKEEAGFGNECLDIWNGNGVNLCGLTSPRVSAAVLQKAIFFVGHDSGPMHLAASVGTPCVGIFSARNLPGQWFPRGSNNKILYHQTECYGCKLHDCNEHKKKCILSISVDEVKESIISIIDI